MFQWRLKRVVAIEAIFGAVIEAIPHAIVVLWW